LSDSYWQKHYNGAKRVTQDTVAEREPQLAILMAEARESEKKHHGKRSSHSGAKKKAAHKKKH
jgi:hypothetical protein